MHLVEQSTVKALLDERSKHTVDFTKVLPEPIKVEFANLYLYPRRKEDDRNQL